MHSRLVLYTRGCAALAVAFTLASCSGGTTDAITGQNGAPTVTLSAHPTTVTSGAWSTLTWSSTNATSCNASSTPALSSWSGALSASRLNFGDYHTVAEYNPVHKVTIFCGGEIYSPYQAFTTLYKLAPDGTITALAPAPFTLRVNQSIVTVDKAA